MVPERGLEPPTNCLRSIGFADNTSVLVIAFLILLASETITIQEYSGYLIDWLGRAIA